MSEQKAQEGWLDRRTCELSEQVVARPRSVVTGSQIIVLIGPVLLYLSPFICDCFPLISAHLG